MSKLQPKNLVLYADDDPDDIELVKDAFKAFSHNIDLVTFNNGLSLIEYLQQLDPFDPVPCLIILDINMPRMDGKSTLAALRKMDRFNEIGIVLFSTSTLPSDATFAKAFGAGFVTKPLNSSQIHFLFDHILEYCPEDVKQLFKNNNN